MGMAKIGRPPTDNPRTHVVPVRLSEDEMRLVRSAAETAGETVGAWLRAKAVAAAKRAR
jgi:uncharacterized protein (DUF1778 family)